METITPHLYSVHRFSYGKQNSGRMTLTREKTQYVYRLLIFEEGEAEAVLGGRRFFCRAGDFLYLPPGERYRLFADNAFSVLQVSFDLFGAAAEGRPLFCVFTSEFSPSLCSPLPKGEALTPLLHGGIFSGTSALRGFSDLLGIAPASPLWRIYGGAALYAALAEALRATAPCKGGGEDILAYISAHPEENPTATTLAERFSYHPNYVNALIKRASGLSLGALLRRTKIAYACDLLTHGGLSPLEASVVLGYYDYSHFYKAFKAEKGCSPTAYLAAHGGMHKGKKA